MKSLGQTTGEWNEKQLKLYLKLMCEELGETITAAFPGIGLTAQALCDKLEAGPCDLDAMGNTWPVEIGRFVQ